MVNYKYEINQEFKTFNRNLRIIDKKIIPRTAYKNGKPYTNNAKYYKYLCLICGNTDWLVEYQLCDKAHTGCNACCKSPHKLVVGVNDITTTAPWMVKCFIGGEQEARKYFKTSREIIQKCLHTKLLKRQVCLCG